MAPISIGSRALDLLGLLIERQGQLVSKDAIMQAVWPGMVVEDGNLTVQISALRRILDENREGSSCIQTVPGRGYRFIAPVTRVEPVAPPGSAWRRQREHRVRAAWLRLIGILCLFIFATAAALHWHSLGSEEARSVPRLSIIVLPFTNLGEDREQQYFADGITEDLTADLSRIAPMFVISPPNRFRISR